MKKTSIGLRIKVMCRANWAERTDKPNRCEKVRQTSIYSFQSFRTVHWDPVYIPYARNIPHDPTGKLDDYSRTWSSAGKFLQLAGSPAPVRLCHSRGRLKPVPNVDNLERFPNVFFYQNYNWPRRLGYSIEYSIFHAKNITSKLAESKVYSHATAAQIWYTGESSPAFSLGGSFILRPDHTSPPNTRFRRIKCPL